MARKHLPERGVCAVAAVAAAAVAGCHCGGAADTSAARARAERSDTVSERAPSPQADKASGAAPVDPFTDEKPPPLPALTQLQVEAPPIRLSSQSAAGRAGDRAAVIARDWSKDASLWVTLDAAGHWSPSVELPILSAYAVTDCGDAVFVSGSTETEFLYHEVTRAGDIVRRLDIDVPDEGLLGVPSMVCTPGDPALVFRQGRHHLAIATESGRDVVELDAMTGSVAAAAAVGEAVVILRYRSRLPELSNQLELLAIEDGAITRRLDVGDAPHAADSALLARDGYLLVLWLRSPDHKLRAQVVAGDLSRAGPVRVLHTGEGQLRRLRLIESRSGRIAAVWEEAISKMRLAASGRERKAHKFYAAFVDPLGRALGPPTRILRRAGQYVVAAFAGEDLVVYGGGRAASVERYRAAASHRR